MATKSASEGHRFEAFISYRHVEPDRAMAIWLHRSLERYRTPAKLVRGAGISARIKRVFRDEEEMRATPNLPEDLRSALDASRYLIVVCSPRVQKSHWVSQEIARFNDTGRGDRVLALLIEGEPEEAFPQALRESARTATDPDGMAVDAEPLAADARARPGESTRKIRRLALLRILAVLLGCEFDDLRQRDHEQRARRLRRWLAASVFLLVLMTGLAIFAVAEGRRADRRAKEARERLLLSYEELGRFELMQGRPYRAAPYLAAGYAGGRRGSTHRFLLRRACRVLDARIAIVHGSGHAVEAMAVAERGSTLAWATRDGTVRVLRTDTGRKTRSFESESQQVLVVAVDAGGRHVAWEGTGGVVRLLDIHANAPPRDLGDGGEPITAMQFSPDGGTRLAVARRNGHTRLFDTSTGEVSADLPGHGATVTCIAFDPSATHVVTAGASGLVRISSTDGGTPRVLRGHTDYVWSVAFSSDGTRLLTASADGTVRVWDAMSGEQDGAPVVAHRGTIWSAVFGPAGRLVLAAGDHAARMWDLVTRQMVQDFGPHATGVRSARFGPRGLVVTTDNAGSAGVWIMGIPRRCLSLGTGSDERAVVSADGSRVATSTHHGSISLWDATSTSLLASLSAHRGTLWSGAFDTSGTRVVTAGDDAVARIWDVDRARVLHELRGHKEQIWKATFSHDSALVATASRDDTARLWDAKTGDQRAVLSGHEASVGVVAFRPDDRFVVTGCRDGRVRVFDSREVGESEPIHEFSECQGAIDAVAFDGEGSRLAAADTTGQLYIYDGRKWSQVASRKAHRGAVRVVQFAPDRALLLTAGDDGWIRLWDAKTGKAVGEVHGHAAAVLAAAFSPDGTRMVSTANDGSMRIWRVDGCRELVALTGHSARVGNVMFSPEGSRVVSTDGAGMIKLWDVSSGNLLLDLQGHSTEIQSCAFDPRGERLLTTGRDGWARLWDVAPETRSRSEIAKLLRAKCPYALMDGRLVKVTPGHDK